MASDAWRRSTLSYRDRFVDDFVLRVPGAGDGAPALRIAQAPCASAAAARLPPASSAPAAPSSPPAGSARDPVPETGFTVWDASILLAAYVTQPATWARLVAPRARARSARSRAPNHRPPTSDAPSDASPPSPASPVVVLELGAGTGAAGLAVAATGLPSVVAMTDLPEILPHLRHNARRNARSEGGPIPPDVALAACALRWGEEGDVDALPAPCRDADVVLGADLAYTTDARVIDALVETLDRVVPTDGVAVFASCVEHRPEAVARFERGAEARGFDARVVGRGELGEGFGRGEGEDDAFRVVELRRRRGGGGGRGGEVRPGSSSAPTKRGGVSRRAALQETASFASQRSSSVRFSRGQ